MDICGKIAPLKKSYRNGPHKITSRCFVDHSLHSVAPSPTRLVGWAETTVPVLFGRLLVNHGRSRISVWPVMGPAHWSSDGWTLMHYEWAHCHLHQIRFHISTDYTGDWLASQPWPLRLGKEYRLWQWWCGKFHPKTALCRLNYQIQHFFFRGLFRGFEHAGTSFHNLPYLI